MNKLVVTVMSGLSADGFDVYIKDENDDVLEKDSYRYGYNASYKQDFASEKQPFVTDILSSLEKKYGCSQIIVESGKNVFAGTKIAQDDVTDFIQKYVNPMQDNKLADRIIDVISDGYDDEENRDESVNKLRAELESLGDGSELKAALDELCNRLEELTL